jgi:hypothetical protein
MVLSVGEPAPSRSGSGTVNAIDRAVEYIEPVYLPPQLVADHGAYVVLWHTEALRFDFDRIRSQRRSGEVSAEVSVTRLLEPNEPVRIGRLPNVNDVIQSGIRVNLTSLQTRSTLARALEGAKPRGDWAGLVETSLRMVRDAIRTGQPAVLLRDVAADAAGYLAEPIVGGHGSTVWFGDGSAGKSLLALAIAAALQTGDGRVLELRNVAQRRVLFLDYEWDATVHRQRLAQIVGDEMPDLAYLRCEVPLHEDVDHIRAEVRRTQSDFLVVDSASWAAGDEPEAADSAKAFYGALRQIGLDALVTAHTTKVGADAKPFGSVFWHNGARLTWHASGEQELDDNTLRIGLVNRKNNAGRLWRPLAWQVTFGERITFERVEASSLASVAQKMSIAERAKESLVTGSRTVADLAEEFNEKVESVRQALDREVRRGKFVKFPNPGDGNYRYGLAMKGGRA